MPKARLKVKPPDGPAELSTKYPNDEYRFLASRYREDEVVTFFEAETRHPDAVIQFIDEPARSTPRISDSLLCTQYCPIFKIIVLTNNING